MEPQDKPLDYEPKRIWVFWYSDEKYEYWRHPRKAGPGRVIRYLKRSFTHE